MPEATDPFAPLYNDVIDAPVEAGEPLPGAEPFRPRNRTAVAVAEAPRDFHVTYSLRDLHRLTSLSAHERDAVGEEWRAWHRKHASLGRARATAWIVAAVAAWVCLFRGEAPLAWFALNAGVSMPAWFVIGIGGAIALGLLVTAPGMFSTLAASALGDAYVAGYADGLTSGVNRALQITPEREAEMWRELHDAQAGDRRPRPAARRGTSAAREHR